MKRQLRKTGTILLICAISVALFEGLCTAWTWWKYGTVSVPRIVESETRNTFLADIRSTRSSIVDCYQPHPYFGYVLSKKIESDRPDYPRRLNNVGLIGDDFPLERDPTKFTILLTGGSTACQFGSLGNLAEILNEKYDFGGRQVVVLNAANGGWHQPQQAIAELLYGDIADAVVSLDGFNERSAFEGKFVRLERTNNSFLEINPNVDGGFDKLGAAWQADQLRQFALSLNSRGVYLVTRVVRKRLEAGALAPTPEEGKVNLRTIFELPKDWDEQKQSAFNMSQYQKYIRLMHAMSSELGIKEAYFIQPSPTIKKTLTEDERRVVGKLDYAESYRQMTDNLLTLNDRGIPVVSLLDCFEGTAESVYLDRVHNNAAGYRIMAERIAAELGRLWELPVRQK